MIKSIEDEMGRAYSTHGEKMKVYRFLVGNPKGNRLLGRPRRRCGIILKCILEEHDIVDGLNSSD
jgi:hypothetical protein